MLASKKKGNIYRTSAGLLVILVTWLLWTSLFKIPLPFSDHKEIFHDQIGNVRFSGCF